MRKKTRPTQTRNWIIVVFIGWAEKNGPILFLFFNGIIYTMYICGCDVLYNVCLWSALCCSIPVHIHALTDGKQTNGTNWMRDRSSPLKKREDEKKPSEQKTVLGSRSNSFSLSLVFFFIIIIVINTRSLYSIAWIEFDLCLHTEMIWNTKRDGQPLKFFSFLITRWARSSSNIFCSLHFYGRYLAKMMTKNRIDCK